MHSQFSLLFRRLKYFYRTGLRNFILVLLSIFYTIYVSHLPLSATEVLHKVHEIYKVSSDLIQQGSTLYKLGRFQEAANAFEEAAFPHGKSGSAHVRAVALINLALAQQQTNRLIEARNSVDSAVAVLSKSHTSENLKSFAHALEVQGQIRLNLGQASLALESLQRAEKVLKQLNDRSLLTSNLINQAIVLQQLGLYNRVISILDPLALALRNQTSSRLSVLALRTLGDTQRLTSNLTSSRNLLEDVLQVATQLQIPDEIAATQISLANTAYAQDDFSNAELNYQNASSSASSPVIRTQALLNLSRFYINSGKLSEASPLLARVHDSIDDLPINHESIFAQINLALGKLIVETKGDDASPVSSGSLRAIAPLLASAYQQAKLLGDIRAESFALGSIGKLYMHGAQWPSAQKVTQQALSLVQQLDGVDISYAWHWQLGRIYKAQREAEAAVKEYEQAISNLQSLRKDLISNPEEQFSFSQNIEPMFREFVDLLLDPKSNSLVATGQLEQARNAIESLQLAELENFLRVGCLQVKSTTIDSIDQEAAVIYPILLSDRVEIIVNIPKTGLHRYKVAEPKERVETVVNKLFKELYKSPDLITNKSDATTFIPESQDLYNWLVRPVEADLVASQTSTLVFVLDGALRNIPMSVLYDGSNYLIEKYKIALTPGLQLLPARPLQNQKLSILMAGLTEARSGFSALPNVSSEINKIRLDIPNSLTLLNEEFTNEAFYNAVNRTTYPVVHLATHGQFYPSLDETYLLTWDGKITINQLSSLLQSAELNRRRPIELLVLSACETAAGDARSTLGLAGLAVRSGARSTIATLWQVSDPATASLMEKLYFNLQHHDISKAEALRQAQLSLLQDPQYRHPFFWSPFVLVGNWL